MLALALILLSQVTPDSRVSRVERVPGGRMEGGRGGVKGWAFFEAFPVGGAGTTTACSTTPPTGAKGEALTFTRGSVATCTATATGGLVSSGIANGDLVELSSNVARVEYDSAGVKGLRVEGSGQNVLPRFIDYTNGAWSDVGTPTPTTGQASPFSGTYANSAVLYDDNDGAGFEGRSIPVTVSAGSAYIAHCYVKAGTATSARIVLDGTAATITGLSSSTWSIVEVADASASAASVTFEVDVGSTAATTGSVAFGGCDVKLGTYRTSIVPTVAAAVTRSAESASFDGLSINSANGLSWAATVWHLSGNGGGVWGAGPNLVQDASNRTQLYRANTNVQNCDYFSTSGNRTVGTVITAYVAGQAYRQACAYSGAGASSTISNYRDGSIISTSAAGLTSVWTATSVLPGALGTAATTAPCDCITSRVCVETNSTRCR